MTIDWDLVVKLAGPVIGALAGAGVKHLFDSRPRVVAFLGHVSGISLKRDDGYISVGTHSVVLRNAGNKTAKNVRIGHNVLPDFQVSPDVQYSIESLPGGQKEIKFDQLIPKKQLTITYLYFPPLTWEQINTHLETEDGPIKVLRVLPTIQLSKPVISTLWILMGIGLVTILYLMFSLVGWVLNA
jgi:hypothetical protein